MKRFLFGVTVGIAASVWVWAGFDLHSRASYAPMGFIPMLAMRTWLKWQQVDRKRAGSQRSKR